MSGQLILRLDPEQKSKLARLSKAEGKSTSEVLRDLIDQFIRDRDLAGYIDGLWNRIGRKMRGKGFRLLTEFRISGARAQPFAVAVRSTFYFAGIRWRVIEVRA